MPQKTKITVHIREETAEWLEKESQKIGGSNRYKGEIIDSLVDHEGSDNAALMRKMEQIEEKLESSTGGSTSTHTDSDIPEDLLQKLENQDPVDPDEYDMTVLKGTNYATDGLICIANHAGGTTKKEIQIAAEEEIGYSVNAARSKRDAAMSKLEEVSADLVEEKIQDIIEEEIDNKMYANATTGSNSSLTNIRVDNPREWWREEYSDPEDFLQQSLSGAWGSPVYCVREDVPEVLTVMEDEIDVISQNVIRDRCVNLIQRIQEEKMEVNEELNEEGDI